MKFVNKSLMITNLKRQLNNQELLKLGDMCIKLKGQCFLKGLKYLALNGCFLVDCQFQDRLGI